MTFPVYFLLMALWAALFLLIQADSPRELVDRLRSDRVEEREEAARKLKALGRAAKSELEKAAKDPEPEVAARAGRLARRIDLLETLPARLLKALPGVEDRLSTPDEHVWTEVFLEASAKRDECGRLPALKNADLEPIVARALRAARSVDERRALCESIRSRRLRSADSCLLELLSHADADLRTGALWAMGEDVPSEVADRLRGQLKDPDPEVRFTGARGLARIGAREAMPDLIRLLRDPEAEVRSGTLISLAQLGARSSSAEIAKALDDPALEVRYSAMEALYLLRARDRAADLVKRLDDPEHAVRRGALFVVGRLGGKAEAEAAAKFLESREPEMRRMAVEALASLNAANSASVLLPRLEDGDPTVRGAAIDALHALKAEGAVARGLELLARKDAGDRIGGMLLMGRFRVRESAPRILGLLKDGDLYVRAEAAVALGKIGVADAAPQLQALLQAANERERRESATALGRLGAKDAVAGLLRLLKDADAGVRSAAAVALGRLGVQEAVRPLLGLLSDDDEGVAQEAVQALARLGSREWIGDLPALLSHARFPLLDDLLHALEGLEAWDASPRIATLLEMDDPEVRIAAAAWLCQAGAREGVRILLEESTFVPLNALREPEAWTRLRRCRVAFELRGTRREVVRRLAREAGVAVEIAPDDGAWEDVESWAWEDPIPVARALAEAMPDGFTFVVEKGKIVVLTRDAAARFWKEWKP